jgi:hypothetical protein
MRPLAMLKREANSAVVKSAFGVIRRIESPQLWRDHTRITGLKLINVPVTVNGRSGTGELIFGGPL